LEGTYVEYDPIKWNDETELHQAHKEEERKTFCPVKKSDGSLAKVAFDFSKMT
jgi:hypothetical protein